MLLWLIKTNLKVRLVICGYRRPHIHRELLLRTEQINVTFHIQESFSKSYPCLVFFSLFLSIDIHYIVGDKAFWWKCCSVWMLRLKSPAVCHCQRLTFITVATFRSPQLGCKNHLDLLSFQLQPAKGADEEH